MNWLTPHYYSHGYLNGFQVTTKYLGSLVRFELTCNSVLDKIELKYLIICLNSSFYQYSVKLLALLVRRGN